MRSKIKSKIQQSAYMFCFDLKSIVKTKKLIATNIRCSGKYWIEKIVFFCFFFWTFDWIFESIVYWNFDWKSVDWNSNIWIEIYVCCVFDWKNQPRFKKRQSRMLWVTNCWLALLLLLLLLLVFLPTATPVKLKFWKYFKLKRGKKWKP